MAWNDASIGSFDTGYEYTDGATGWSQSPSLAHQYQEDLNREASEKFNRYMQQIHDLDIKDPQKLLKKPSKPKGDQPMEILFNVIVVSKDREVLLDEKVVANDEGEAQLAIDLHACLKGKGLKPRDVTILVQEIGEVKVRKDVQKVKMVEKDEE